MRAYRGIANAVGGALTLAMLTSHPAVGAEDTPGNAAAAHRWMFQFRIGPNFVLDGFQDAGLSVQRSLSDRSALRLGVGIAAASGTSSALRQDFSSMATATFDGATRLQTYGLDLQWIRYRPAGEQTRVYWGLGPSLGYGRSRNSEGASFGSGPLNWVLRKQSTWVVAAGAVAGAEWWPEDEFGLIFEYGLSVRYREFEDRIRIETPPPQPRAESRALAKSWETELAAVRLGVGIRL